LRLKVQNRSEAPQRFRVEVLGIPDATLIAPELPLEVGAGEQASASFFVSAPSSSLRGKKRIQLRVSDGPASQLVTYTLLGPEGETAP
jgi:hypothetical protein